MPEQKKFNLLRFVYGELYLNSRTKTVATITVEVWKAESWRNILNWLNNRNHITALKIERISPTHRRISYIFNDYSLIYPSYIRYLKGLSG